MQYFLFGIRQSLNIIGRALTRQDQYRLEKRIVWFSSQS